MFKAFLAIFHIIHILYSQLFVFKENYNATPVVMTMLNGPMNKYFGVKPQFLMIETYLRVKIPEKMKGLLTTPLGWALTETRHAHHYDRFDTCILDITSINFPKNYSFGTVYNFSPFWRGRL